MDIYISESLTKVFTPSMSYQDTLLAVNKLHMLLSHSILIFQLSLLGFRLWHASHRLPTVSLTDVELGLYTYP
ncbi:putative transcriptional regulatory protein C1F7.11c [Fusarium oxysporum f. sp. albedinis]|nr:putative transcriptional regulatory protein C1F7.11c [Fusarium oxysporum f. sp. albedinis]